MNIRERVQATIGSITVNSVLALMLLQGFAGTPASVERTSTAVTSQSIHRNMAAVEEQGPWTIANRSTDLLSIWA